MEALGDFVDCPSCRNVVAVAKAQAEQGVDFYAQLRIPKAYQDATAVGQEIFNTGGMLPFTQSSIHEVASFLESINKAVYNGGVLNLSAYIYTTNVVDVKRFVYGVQKLALEKSLSVVPYISLNTLYALQRVGDFSLTSLKDLSYRDAQTGLKDVPPDLIHALDGYRLVQESDMTYYDYITADLCIVEATANTTEKGWTGLADLLGERAKQGLPTYVIGYWTSKTSDYHAKGLRYLMQQTAINRLDLLVPYEVKTSKGSQDGVTLTRPIPTETTTSPSQHASAGISLNDILGHEAE